MKYKILSELSTIWEMKSPKNKQSLFNALLESGINPQTDRKVLIDFLQTLEAEKVLEDSTTYTYYDFYKVYDEEQEKLLQEERKVQCKDAIDDFVSKIPQLEHCKQQNELENSTSDIIRSLKTSFSKIESVFSTKSSNKFLDLNNRYDFGRINGIPMRIWNDLQIPIPGATIIGAKTGSGKTTSLINIARETLRIGKRVCFISYEMNKQEIYLALTLSVMAEKKMKKIIIPQDDDSPNIVFDPEFFATMKQYFPSDDNFSDYFSYLKSIISEKGLPEFLKAADEEICSYLLSDRLQITDDLGNAFNLVEHIRNTDYDVYLIDFIQAIPPGTSRGSEGYRRVGQIVDLLRPLVNNEKKCLVMGAQLNREGGEGTNGVDSFDPSVEQFREAGDIEQLATMAIGAGWFKDKEGNRVHYWKILKHRFNGNARDMRMLSERDPSMFRYYYVRRWSRWYRPEEWNGILSRYGAVKEKAKSSGRTKKKDIIEKPV